MAKLSDGKGGSIAKAEAPEKGQRFIFDDHRDAPRGFGLRITAAGGRAFVFTYNFDGRQRRMTIGQWPTWSLAAARDRAQELARMVDSGNDPLEAGRQRRAAPTVSELVDQYVAKHVSGLVSAKPITRYFERDLIPRLGTVKVRDVTRRDLIELIEDKAADTPTAARHLLAYVKGLLDWAVDREFIPMNPAAGIKPKTIKPAGRKNALKPRDRLRVLDREEIRAFWLADTDMHPLTMLALQLVLVTGQRPGEVIGMSWGEINGAWWTIPASRRRKTETAHRVPLTELAQSILTDAKAEADRLSKRRKADPSGLVFELTAGRQPQTAVLSKAVARHRVELGNKDKAEEGGHWRPHDLRRTARTGLSACRIPAEIAERVIGHKAGGIVDVYDQHDFDSEKRTALEAWERRLLAIIDGTLEVDNDKVVGLWGARA